MYITKDNVNKILEKLNLTEEDFIVYVDMKFFLKNMCNPSKPNYKLHYMNKLELHKHFIDIHDILKAVFRKPIHFVYSFEKITYEYAPYYKEEYYSKYFDDEERNEILKDVKEVFGILKNTSAMSDNEDFIDPTSYEDIDELPFIKRHHENKKAIVITRDKSFYGYKDIIVITPEELAAGEMKDVKIPEYYKLVLSLIGFKEYSLPGLSGVREKTAMNIINKIIDRGIYIYYNEDSSPQPLFPITYETLYETIDITRSEYEQILNNWAILNR